METLKSPSSDLPFNGPLETGIRAVLNLHANYPDLLDVQRLTALDFLIVRTSVLHGPVDLHPATPIMTPVTQVRRKSVQEALYLMMSRELVEQVITEKGIYYRAGDYSAFFVSSFRSIYLQELFSRAQWLASHMQELDEEAFETRMSEILTNWVSEFQDEAGSWGIVS